MCDRLSSTHARYSGPCYTRRGRRRTAGCKDPGQHMSLFRQYRHTRLPWWQCIEALMCELGTLPAAQYYLHCTSQSPRRLRRKIREGRCSPGQSTRILLVIRLPARLFNLGKKTYPPSVCVAVASPESRLYVRVSQFPPPCVWKYVRQ